MVELPFKPLKVLDQIDAQQLVNVDEPNKWNVVSLWSEHNKSILDTKTGLYTPATSTHEQPDFSGAKNLTQHYFHDVENLKEGGQLCSLEQIIEILAFAAKYREEPVLVHCFAGISRSPAIAILMVLHAIKETSNNPYTDALTIVWNVRPIMKPNQHILNLGVPLIAGDNDVEVKWYRHAYNSRIISHVL